MKKTICILASRKLYYETILRRALGFVKIWMTSQAKYELKRIICYVHMCTRANVYREQEYLYTVANMRILEESLAEKTSLKYNNDDASLCSIFFGITRYKSGPNKILNPLLVDLEFCFFKNHTNYPSKSIDRVFYQVLQKKKQLTRSFSAPGMFSAEYS